MARGGPTPTLAEQAAAIRKRVATPRGNMSGYWTPAMLASSDEQVVQYDFAGRRNNSRLFIGPERYGVGLTGAQVIGLIAGGVGAVGAEAGTALAGSETGAVSGNMSTTAAIQAGDYTSPLTGTGQMSTTAAIQAGDYSLPTALAPAAGSAVPTAESGQAPTGSASDQPIVSKVGMSDAMLATLSGMSLSDAAALSSLGATAAGLAAGRGRPSTPSAPASPEAPPASQEGKVPTGAELKARRKVGDPTALTGPAGIPFENLILGRATVLGS